MIRALALGLIAGLWFINLFLGIDELYWAEQQAETLGLNAYYSPILAVSQTIEVVETRVSFKRAAEPLLRWPASRTFQTRRGDCGSAARAIILLLWAQGIEAQRFIIWNGSHTAIAWRSGANAPWRFAPGIRAHPRYKTLLGSELSALAEPYSFANWRRFGLPINQLKPFPQWLALTLEVPYFIHSFLLALSFIFLILVWRPKP